MLADVFHTVTTV